jgi:hypothetical protein
MSAATLAFRCASMGDMSAAIKEKLCLLLTDWRTGWGEPMTLTILGTLNPKHMAEVAGLNPSQHKWILDHAQLEVEGEERTWRRAWRAWARPLRSRSRSRRRSCSWQSLPWRTRPC